MRRQLRCWQRQGGKEALASMRYIAQANRNWQDRWVTLLKVGTPKIWITCCVRTDGIAYRELFLTGEACLGDVFFKHQVTDKLKDEEVMESEQVADEPVVVMNVEPMKHW